ncbi:putative type II secretion system protein E [Botrimarina colliarenosi]|uniref:Putative type II secretion system protein E n=1 Tax=Botrimarina colliarenosi TaxID=2528001 RepID=A0A5C6AJW1_9BACT|nr:ATPase, T2SS/T4P/T4SS family [Botrimarina colliarenosi]TWT99696.1 putative type II secretion system protein E [Botrimarina colliarenosi]
MKDAWYFEIGDGQVYGPHPMAKLQKWAAAGNLMPTHRVRHADSDEWLIAAYVDGLELTTAADAPAADLDGAGEPKRRGFRLGMGKPKAKDLETETAPINAVQVCDELMELAFERGASDIHVDPEENVVLLQLRVDGTLEPCRKLAKKHHPAIITRFKVLAGMDIAEHREAQDGRFMVQLGADKRRVDLRVACLPTTHGERLTLRLLAIEASRMTLNRLGLTEQGHKLFAAAIAQPQGMILLTGPTGTGKSTTLYAALRHRLANNPGRIITVEDPVEHDIVGVAQVEVDTADKVAFGSVLRNILRSDPDVIMIGEMRDFESVDVGIKAALTGHLVFSSLHTNSAAGAVTRLIDMGVEPFLVGATLRLCVAQRLLRRLCPKCRQRREMSPAEARALGHPDMAGSAIYEPVGCELCGKRGYRGRVGVFELLPVSPSMQRLIVERAPEPELTAEAKKHGGMSMTDDAVEKLLAGHTSFIEVMTLGLG